MTESGGRLTVKKAMEGISVYRTQYPKSGAGIEIEQIRVTPFFRNLVVH